MRRAIALALENVRSGRGGPFGAVIVKGGQIIAQGTNRVTFTNDPTAHAEVVAIREACRVLGDFQLAGCDLYTTCEPCPMCLGAAVMADVPHVVFALHDDLAGVPAMLEIPYVARHIVTYRGGVLADEAQAVAERYAAIRR